LEQRLLVSFEKSKNSCWFPHDDEEKKLLLFETLCYSYYYSLRTSLYLRYYGELLLGK